MDNATCRTCSQMFHSKWVDMGLTLQSNECDDCCHQYALKYERLSAETAQINDLSIQFNKARRETPGLEFYDWLKKIRTKHPLENKELEYAFTLTAPPNMGLSADKFISACEQLCRTGMTSKYERIVRCAYVIEYHESGAPHLHGVYTTGTPRRILTTYFKRVWKLWDPKTIMGSGHKGGYHSLCRHGQSYADYIAKGDGLGNQGKVHTYSAGIPAVPNIISVSNIKYGAEISSQD